MWAVIEAPSKGWTSAPVLAARRARRRRARRRSCVQQRRVAEPLLDVRLFRNPRFSAASAHRSWCCSSRSSGSCSCATQYLQFVLGYSPSAAGVRVLPYAGAMIVSALGLGEARRAARHQARRDAGMLLFAAGLAVAATVAADTGYGRLAFAFVLMGAGMGLAGAPATESIMGSLPPERANIGSAVNDTTRELGGALGVAVVGSIMSSLYAARRSRGRRRRRDSLGAAVAAGAAVADAAREAFVHAMSRASLVDPRLVSSASVPSAAFAAFRRPRIAATRSALAESSVGRQRRAAGPAAPGPRPPERRTCRGCRARPERGTRRAAPCRRSRRGGARPGSASGRPCR